MSAATMMPTPLGGLPSKPKIGFSIDSIVGATGHETSRRPAAASEASDLSPASSPDSASRRCFEVNRTTSHGSPRRPRSAASSASPSPPPHAVVRPAAALPMGFHLGEATPTPTPTLHHGVHHQHQLALAAAAHFQAAGLAAALGHGGPGFPPGQPGHMGQHHHAAPRDSYPLYPWLLSRHGRIFPHRFPQGPDIPGFLLQPFRKPKRIRTAFSPSQLLKLEHAFEKNHYVVGAERKQLAQALSLTETQVKVWFQNRRTKHKRMQQEEEAKAAQSAHAQSGGGGSKNSHHASKWKQETQSAGRDEPETPEDAELDVDSCSSASGEET